MNTTAPQEQEQEQESLRKIGFYYNPYDYKVYVAWVKDKYIYIKDSFKLLDTQNLIIFAKMLHESDEIIYASSHLKHKQDELELHNALMVIKNNTQNFYGYTPNIKEASLMKTIHNFEKNYSNIDIIRHSPVFYATALGYYGYK